MKKILEISFAFFLFTFYIINIDASSIMSEKSYESYNIRRSYIVGDYIFDLSKHNPTLEDLMLAAQSQEKGEVAVYEIIIAEDINGKKTKVYKELLDNKKLTSFPAIHPVYICEDKIGKNQKKI